MRVALASVQVPFIRGGAEALAYGLLRACRARGIEADLITLPFRFAPAAEVERGIAAWRAEDFCQLNGYTPDRVICLKFPTYHLQHPHKVAWLLHQHRAVYDLWDTPFGGSAKRPEDVCVRERVRATDDEALARMKGVYTIAGNVSRRLREYNGIESTPLYHPPPLAGRLYAGEPEPFVFVPSRLEGLKRQDLLIRAMARVKAPVVALLAGGGGQEPAMRRLIAKHDLDDRVALLGEVDEATMLACYARCRAVFFGPRDEDYGYVTLEAMLAQKPVITCSDSGGPLEFVVDGETGLVVEPQPDAVAGAIERLARAPERAAGMGKAGLARYRDLNVSWDAVVETLTS